MGRPRTPLLDRARIVDAAFRLVDRSGDLTIPALAKELQVSPSALYHHVAGRAEIVAMMRAELVRTIGGRTVWDLPWDEALAVWARSYRDAFAEHPGIVRVLATAPLSEPFMHAMYELAVVALEDAGFAAADVMGVITALESFVLGSALDLVAPPVMVDAVARDAAPRLAAALDAVPAGRERADQAFETGLRAILAGYRAMRTAPASAGGA
ncbi:tetracycline repressor, C-all-alpha domain protein [Kitasatospora indigofera]|uniref:Tetracycline repressor, C-all-alpha domain protein n=1 Tax=Kitasatospora indigofera TaxID=67307 RepID=A0A919KPU2_9ACTN|nr:TetR/AcrR family transcriptional regulator C-terminal domain-containing protein [Kitasatospora indigofera]GHH67406.1 tetracycline repressor, C-all-alpha domain protein [Kitasatospora indigofera]